jgi:hypothetical protein
VTFQPTVDPVLLPPKIEVLARAYLLNAMSPTPIITRLPEPNDTADTVNGVLRVEAGGGGRVNRFQYDMTCLLHGYSPDEDQANDIANRAVALASAARGQTISDGTSDWFVVAVPSVGMPQRRTDPDVILPRYLSAVTWRVAGQPWTP